MAYFSECPECGCNLDPGEECECVKKKKQVIKRQAEAIRLVEQGDNWEQLELAI